MGYNLFLDGFPCKPEWTTNKYDNSNWKGNKMGKWLQEHKMHTYQCISTIVILIKREMECSCFPRWIPWKCEGTVTMNFFHDDDVFFDNISMIFKKVSIEIECNSPQWMLECSIEHEGIKCIVIIFLLDHDRLGYFKRSGWRTSNSHWTLHENQNIILINKVFQYT